MDTVHTLNASPHQRGGVLSLSARRRSDPREATEVAPTPGGEPTMPKDGKPVDPQTRAEAVTLMHTGMGRNAIAREVGLAGATITRIAQEEGHSFERKDSELAVRARQIDLARERQEIAQMLLIRAREALEDMDSPTESGHWSSATEDRSASYDVVILDAPTIADRQRLITIAGIGIQRAADLTRASDGGGVDDGIAVITSLARALDAAAGALGDVDPTKVEAPELPDDDGNDSPLADD